MPSSLRVLLAEILDYAGLFPPARLALDEAIQRYARYQHDADHWMLDRFVCPAERLRELEPFVPQWFSSESPLPLSVLGRGGKNVAEFLTGLRSDLDVIVAFGVRHSERVVAGVYEVRAPDDLLAAGADEAARKLFDEIARTFDDTRLPSLTPFFEAAMGSAWRTSVVTLSKALSEENRRRQGPRRQRFGPAGFKLRCGGLEAAAFPSPEQVAFVITTCRNAGVPLKFTAGLHHPIRHFDAGVQTHMHGFLNVFGAGVLAHARRLVEGDIRRILEDEEAKDFVFDEDGLRWKELRATLDEIRAARQSAVISFGSCSFEEPLDDLRALGLLA